MVKSAANKTPWDAFLFHLYLAATFLESKVIRDGSGCLVDVIPRLAAARLGRSVPLLLWLGKTIFSPAQAIRRSRKIICGPADNALSSGIYSFGLFINNLELMRTNASCGPPDFRWR